MSTAIKIEHRDPSALKPHPLRARMPKRAKDSLAFAALTESIHTHGVNEPLAITADGHIIDGIERWHAAKDWQLAAVPCIVHADEDAPRLIVESLTARRQMTRGAAVYCVIPLLTEFFKNCETRRVANIAKGKNTGAEIPKNLRKDQCFSKVAERLSGDEQSEKLVLAKLGVAHETLWQARKLWELLNEHGAHALRKHFADRGLDLTPIAAVEAQVRERLAIEPKLLNEGAGVGAALAGLGGKAATVGVTPERNAHKEADSLLNLFNLPQPTLQRIVQRIIEKADFDHLEQFRFNALEIARIAEEAIAARAASGEEAIPPAEFNTAAARPGF